MSRYIPSVLVVGFVLTGGIKKVSALLIDGMLKTSYSDVYVSHFASYCSFTEMG